MIGALLLAVTAVAIGPELVEGRATDAAAETRASTGSARTGSEMTALDAERAFAADAQKLGQWTAFRKWAAPDGVMFVPQPINAQEWLKDRADPRKSIRWWPTASYVSCDGTLAVNTGGWERSDGAVGFFSTVWQRQVNGTWKWVVDGGDILKAPRPHADRVLTVRASCSNIKPSKPEVGDDRFMTGRSRDGSLIWESAFNATGKTRVFDVSLWDGEKFGWGFEDVIDAK